ncbi:hypothetical protein IJI69_03945, partial [Candidatus Saccharibacteria bacterium]|nr:hypothetical protein [Candidatus Saccharibacteria bacterium]
SAVRARTGTGGLVVPQLRPAKPTTSTWIPMAACTRRTTTLALGTGSQSAAWLSSYWLYSLPRSLSFY